MKQMFHFYMCAHCITKLYHTINHTGSAIVLHQSDGGVVSRAAHDAI